MEQGGAGYDVFCWCWKTVEQGRAGYDVTKYGRDRGRRGGRAASLLQMKTKPTGVITLPC